MGEKSTFIMNISNELLNVVKLKIPELSSANKLTQSDLQRYFRERDILIWITPLIKNDKFYGWYNNYTTIQLVRTKSDEGYFPTYEDALEHALMVTVMYKYK